jgi:hypothetical protein
VELKQGLVQKEVMSDRRGKDPLNVLSHQILQAPSLGFPPGNLAVLDQAYQKLNIQRSGCSGNRGNVL